MTDVNCADLPQQFASDNYSGICPEAWEAMETANHGHAAAYGDDPWTARAADAFRELFETDCAQPTNYNGSAMTLQPDILFHRYFQSEKRSSMDRKHYKGKKDLETLADPLLRLWLFKIQEPLKKFLN